MGCECTGEEAALSDSPSLHTVGVGSPSSPSAAEPGRGGGDGERWDDWWIGDDGEGVLRGDGVLWGEGV